MKKTFIPAILLVIFALNSNKSYAHCEIPCGIYGDSVRIQLLYEHISTIEKSIQQINSLSAEGEKNYNQLVRWVIDPVQKTFTLGRPPEGGSSIGHVRIYCQSTEQS